MKSFFNIIIYSDFEITEDNIHQALDNGIKCSEGSHFKILVNKHDKTIIEALQDECNMKAKVIAELLEKIRNCCNSTNKERL